MSTPLILRLFGIKINLQKPPLKLDKANANAYNKLVLFNRGVAKGLAASLIFFCKASIRT